MRTHLSIFAEFIYSYLSLFSLMFLLCVFNSGVIAFGNSRVVRELSYDIQLSILCSTSWSDSLKRRSYCLSEGNWDALTWFTEFRGRCWTEWDIIWSDIGTKISNVYSINVIIYSICLHFNLLSSRYSSFVMIESHYYLIDLNEKRLLLIKHW